MSNNLIGKFELKILSVCLALLALANILNLVLGMPFWPITRLIHLGSDENAAAWFSSILFFIASIVAYDCWKLARAQAIKNCYLILYFAMLLAFMSLDELARIHETLGDDLAKLTGLNDASFAKNANWVWIGGPVIILIFGYVLYNLKSLFQTSPFSFKVLIIAFACIVVGGVFLESLTNFLNHDNLKLLWDIEVIFEETLEMLGSILIIYSLIIWRDDTIKRI